jgi:hypothetical protein
MERILAAAAMFAVLATAGCATTAPEAATAQGKATAAASGTAERRYITGSRIPENPPRDRLLKSVSNTEWVHETKSSVIGNQPSGN